MASTSHSCITETPIDNISKCSQVQVERVQVEHKADQSHCEDPRQEKHTL